MSDGTPNEDVVTNDPAGMRKVLEKQGRELAEKDEALAERDQLIANFQKAEAFRKAGVPDGDEGTVYDLFRQSYQGELTPESINEAYGKLGLPDTTPQPQAQAEATAAAEQQAAQSQPQAQGQPQIDAATAAAIADGQQLRTQFSPGLEDSGVTAVLEAMNSAESAADIERLARQAGVSMPE